MVKCVNRRWNLVLLVFLVCTGILMVWIAPVRWVGALIVMPTWTVAYAVLSGWEGKEI